MCVPRIENCFWNERQKYGDERAARGRAVNMDQAAVAGDDVVDRTNPNPVPLPALVVKKASNRWARVVASMPLPLSVTTKSAQGREVGPVAVMPRSVTLFSVSTCTLQLLVSTGCGHRRASRHAR